MVVGEIVKVGLLLLVQIISFKGLWVRFSLLHNIHKLLNLLLIRWIQRNSKLIMSILQVKHGSLVQLNDLFLGFLLHLLACQSLINFILHDVFVESERAITLQLAFESQIVSIKLSLNSKQRTNMTDLLDGHYIGMVHRSKSILGVNVTNKHPVIV